MTDAPTTQWQLQQVIDGWFKGYPLWEILEHAKMPDFGGQAVMDWVRHMKLPERHLTTRQILEPQRPVE